MRPQVSVVVTVYNGERYFDRGLPSILAQDFADFEVVIVDDGSTDRTGELLGEVSAADSRVRVLSPGRVGFARALNYGVRMAQGSYIARQDFDDTSRPGRLRLQVDFLNANPQVALVGGAYEVIDENRGERYVRYPPLDHESILRGMPRSIPFAHTVVMFRKEAWEECGEYPEVDDIEDLRLWIEFARRGWSLANLADVLGCHWVHPDSFWHRNFKYRSRQRTLRRVQRKAIRELSLPWWMHIFPAGRLGYGFVPPILKRFARRVLAGSKEDDISPA